MENLIVLVIVLSAAVWGGFRLVRRRKVSSSCSSGSCAGCSCAAKPAPRLVTLRR